MPLRYALRRRFVFFELRPQYASAAFRKHLAACGVADSLVDRIVSRMTALNTAIEADMKNLGPGFAIGHSLFTPVPGGGPSDDRWYESVVRLEIALLLGEYWVDASQRAGKLVAELLAP